MFSEEKSMLSTKKALQDGKKKTARCLKKIKKGSTSECDNWLRDNYSVILQSLTNGLTAARRHKAEFSDAVFETVTVCLKGTEKGNAKALFEKAISERNIPLEMCDAVAPLTFAAAALRAIDRYEDEPEVFGSAVKVLFALRDVDFEELLPNICAAEHLLMLDPSGDYPKSDRRTKAHYRKAVCRAAEKSNMSDEDYLKNALANASHSGMEHRHIGFHIPIAKTNRSAGKAFIFFEFLLTLILSITATISFTNGATDFFSTVWGRLILSVLVFLPMYAALRPLFDRLSAKIFPPAFLASLDPELTDEIPPAAIAVSSVLPKADKIKNVKEHLRKTKLSDDSPDTVLVFLCDLKNADVPSLPDDNADIRAATKMIDELNVENGGGFVFALRDRVFAPTESTYGGYERKRGALCALVRLITDGENAFSVLTGDTKKMLNAKYLLALDSDTTLPFESLKKLVCTACHPLNRPIFSSDDRRVTEGYGIIAPRVETSADSAEKTVFSAFMTLGGISAYSAPVSERYMDMFSSSLFTGKGLIDIEAFSKTCIGAFPDGLILSHDIPEGALMNTAFAGGVCLSDSFPSKPSAYRKREHRWIRGDVQNLRLLFGTTNGSATSAKLPPLAKYQLLDNFRRALTPVAAFICLMLSVIPKGGASTFLLAVSFLSVISEPAVSFVSELLRLGAKALTSIYLTASAGVGAKSLIRAIYCVASLPEAAAVSFSAVTKGLYRGFISHRRTLEWTTAADGEHGRMRSAAEGVFSLISAVVLCFASPLHRLWAVLILCNIPFSLSGGIPNVSTTEKLSDNERETLKSYAAAEWRYFEKYVTAEENYLPPDNVQLSPVRRTAHRTSPTDIGMYIMSCLVAADLSIIDEDELESRLSKTVGTLQRLPRVLGLLYNWYDTRTLEVLPPDFISTVDCGNYLCCLSALGEGLRRMAAGTSRFSKLISFINAEITSSDLGILFSKRRGLFSIGMNGSDKTLSTSYYDTYMSEMRLTSFFATALREVPASHNEKLSRAAVSSGLYTSASSWTGTAFEYLMPSLFLPTFENTFVGEALRNCVREQKKLSRGTAMPWGISESGYYAFDRELNYKYKAHGIKKLALKTDADCEKVFSPYSSFLALAVAPTDAMKNLARFVSLGSFGACGFYEALDFTRERVAPESYMVVRSFMAHHKGMSIIACGNALFDGINIRRFTDNGKMKAAESLLTEKLPAEAPFATRPKKQKEDSERKKTKRSNREDSDMVRYCSFWSDGEASLLCTADGKNRLFFSSLSVFGTRKSVTGIFAAVRIGDETIPLSQNGKGTLKTNCYYNKCVSRHGIFEHALCLSRTATGVYAPLKITNTTDGEKLYELLFYVEPELTPADGIEPHKSYSDMFIKTEYNRELHCITFERHEKGSAVGAIALGFADSEPFVFTCRRTDILSTNEELRFPFENGVPLFSNDTADVAPCFAVKLGLRLKSREKREKVLVTSVGEDKAEALNKLSRLRGARLPKTEGNSLCSSQISAGIRKTAESYLLTRFFDYTRSLTQSDARDRNTLPLSSLWEKGISGDLGILRVNADDAPPSLFGEFINFHAVMSKSGCPFDLVFTFYSPDDYASSSSEKLRSIIKKMHADGFLGARGGIHIINLFSGSPNDVLLTAVSDAVFPDDAGSALPPEEKNLLHCTHAIDGESGFVPNGYFINEKTSFPMSHTLSNGTVGTLVTATSLGFTWFENARLCPLTPRPYDASEPLTGERLYLEKDGTATDCINGSSVFFFDDRAVYRSVIGEANCDVTVSVARRGAIKNITVRLSGITDACSLVYELTPILHEKRDFAKLCRRTAVDGGVLIENPFNADYKGFLLVGCAGSKSEITESGKIRLTMCFEPSNEKTEAVFKLVFSASKKGIKPLYNLQNGHFSEKRVHFSSGSKELDMFSNALLYHQAADSRLRSRTGFYQCSGAFGFRDQLQDALCTVRISPEKTKRMIFTCAAAQFVEGDVLHWFHQIPSLGKKGVRTHCSDDMLWLPLTASIYADETGDLAVFEKDIPYLYGEKLRDGEKQRYELFKRSRSCGSLYEHCMKSIFRACEFGKHGLPLIKDGDWNDSFGEIGEHGLGESVWLAMLLKLVCGRMLPYVLRFGKEEHAELIKEIMLRMEENIKLYAFNGRFFTRAFFDDGTPLGDGSGNACRIDLLPQAFASFAGVGTAEMRRSALLCAYKELVDDSNGIIKLFTPPFNEKTRRAGYVNDYPEGVRENGGQYTHAAVWFALALLREGLTHEAATVTGLLLPSLKGKKYEREPYAMCGDVYSAKGIEGKGGWSLYTGAAGWMLALTAEWERYSQNEKNATR